MTVDPLNSPAADPLSSTPESDPLSQLQSAESAGALQPAEKPDKWWLFKPGQSGNPKGRPPKGQTYRERYEAAIGHELEAIAKRQASIAKHSKDDRAAVQAGSYVVDQLIGKAQVRVELDVSLAEQTMAMLPEIEAEYREIG